MVYIITNKDINTLLHINIMKYMLDDIIFNVFYGLLYCNIGQWYRDRDF